MAEKKTLDAKSFAEALGTDAKTARRFLRKQGMGVGQGNRYEIPAGSVTRLKKAFAKWQKDEEAKKVARENKAAAAKTDKDDEAAETAETVEAPQAEEPTEQDIADIEAEEVNEVDEV